MIRKNDIYLGAFLSEEAAKERQLGTFGLYMPSLTSSLSRTTSGNTTNSDKSKFDVLNLGLTGRVPQLGLQYDSTIYNNVQTYLPEPESNTGSFNFRLSLSLLKDFGPRVGNIPFDRADNNLTLARQFQIKTVYEIFSTLLSSYTSALALQKNFLISKDSESLTKEELRKSNELFKAGKIPRLSLLSLQSQAAQIRSQLIGQERSLTQTFTALYTLASINTNYEKLPYDETLEELPPLFDEKIIEFHVNEKLNFANLKNPDYLISKINLENAKLGILTSENNVYPSLSLSWSESGAETFQNQPVFFPRENYGRTIGINFSMPIGLITEKRELAASRAEFSSKQNSFEQTKRKLQRDWENIIDQYSLLRNQVLIQSELVSAAKDKYEASRPTGYLGAIYQQNIISFQNEWVLAQVNLNQLQVELIQLQLQILTFHADPHLITVLNRL